jgi:class 3 adenylate cyclase
MLGITMSAAKKRMSLKAVSRVYPLLASEDVQLMSKLYESVEAIGDEDIQHHMFDINDEEGKEKTYTLYVCFFAEGVFFSFLPADQDSTALMELLSQRNRVLNEILKKRRPFLTNLVTMVADLQGSMKICSELPAEEYFELINDIWAGAEPIFRRYNATHGKHVGDGMVYYFLPQPDTDYLTNALYCAHELRELMREMTRDWNVRKNWGHELKLNIGLNEGQEWFGTYHSGTHIEFTVLGDTINHASRLSDFARDGAIWATKAMLSKLKREARKNVRYGVHRPGANEQKILSPDLFAQVSNLIDLEEGKHFKFRDIAALPIAEVVDVIIPRED